MVFVEFSHSQLRVLEEKKYSSILSGGVALNTQPPFSYSGTCSLDSHEGRCGCLTMSWLIWKWCAHFNKRESHTICLFSSSFCFLREQTGGRWGTLDRKVKGIPQDERTAWYKGQGPGHCSAASHDQTLGFWTSKKEIQSFVCLILFLCLFKLLWIPDTPSSARKLTCSLIICLKFLLLLRISSIQFLYYFKTS